MYTVTTTHLPSRMTNSFDFVSYKDAFNYYCEKAYDCNIDESGIEYPGCDQDPDLIAGGRGYDYLIELTQTND